MNIDIQTIKWGKDGEAKESSAEIGGIIGMIFTIIIYMFILMYGVMVMQGVMEEKTNRIVEVMVSSVRPFDLMMGKIIGVGLVGITQVVIWCILPKLEKKVNNYSFCNKQIFSYLQIIESYLCFNLMRLCFFCKAIKFILFY